MSFRQAAAAALLGLAAAPAFAAERGFAVPGFDRVESTGAFDVRIHTGAAPSVRASGEREVLDRLSVHVEGGRLILGMKPSDGWHWSWRAHKPTVIAVTAPMVRAVTLTGSGDVAVDSVRTRDFAAALGGSGNVTVGALQAETATLTLTGSGNLTAKGRVGRTALALRGSGNLRAGELAARDTTITLTGAGDVDAMATGAATVSLAGVGNVTVTGGARCATARHGVGTIRCG